LGAIPDGSEGKLTFRQRKPLRDSVANGRKTNDASLRAEDLRRQVSGVNGETLEGANPREAAGRKRRNNRGRLTNSQREKHPKADRGVRWTKQFGCSTLRNSKRVEAVNGPFGPLQYGSQFESESR
jgi:hypothetical protein